jgi:hypothetical protein
MRASVSTNRVQAGNSECNVRNLAALSLSSTVHKRIDQIIKAEQKLGCAE